MRPGLLCTYKYTGVILVLLVLLGCGTTDDKGKDGSTSSGDAVVTGKTGIVSGTVVCSCSATVKIPNVTVAIGAISSQTDIQGSYKLEGVPTGKQTITAKGSPAHHDYSQQIEVVAGANTHAITMDLK